MQRRPEADRTRREQLARDLDGVVGRSFYEAPPSALYHYTTWQGAAGILKQQRFWATAYDCTNDPGELQTADETVRTVASRLMAEQKRECAHLLQLLRDGLPGTNVASVAAIYLVCFSAARDKLSQWKEYGESGRGICLAVPLLQEAPPDDGISRLLVRVHYDQAEVDARVQAALGGICEILERSLSQGIPWDEETKLQALNSLYRVSGIAALATKTRHWSSEEEWRVAAIISRADDRPLRRTGRDGREVKYIELPLRANSQLALCEIILGPNQEQIKARNLAQALLRSHRYSTEGTGAPKVSMSQAAGIDSQ